MARTDPRPTYGAKRRVRDDGYVDLFVPSHPLARTDGYVFEHRKVAYDAGLLTDLALHVHHIDGDKKNNNVSNLEVLDISEHAHRHLESGVITNQYGSYNVGTGIARRNTEIRKRLGQRYCEVWRRNYEATY
jgi:hypothetical protein